jgi:hypothetical protein
MVVLRTFTLNIDTTEFCKFCCLSALLMYERHQRKNSFWLCANRCVTKYDETQCGFLCILIFIDVMFITRREW